MMLMISINGREISSTRIMTPPVIAPMILSWITGADVGSPPITTVCNIISSYLLYYCYVPMHIIAIILDLPI